MKKKILALLLSLGLAAAGLPAQALAAGTGQEAGQTVRESHVDMSDVIIQEGGFPQKTEDRAGAALDSGKKEQAQKAILEAWDSFSSVCDLSAYQIPIADFKEIYAEALNKNPRYFYVSGEWAYSHNGSIVIKVSITYSMSQSEAKSMRNAYDQAVAAAVSGAQASWSDMEKALYINDYLARNCQYDRSLQKHTAYDALVGKTAVCQGYALAFLELARQLGLSCEMVTSASINHAWNMVKLGGSYYNVDVTWNDPLSDLLGRARHVYFMKSTTYFKRSSTGNFQSHLGSSNDWVVSGGIRDTAASNTKYDNYFWNQANVGFDYIDGSWYGFDGTDSICRYSCDGTDFTSRGSVQKITDVWPVMGQAGSYWQGKFVGTGSLNGKYYYSGRDSIYELDAATGKSSSAFTLSAAQKQRGYIYGMNVSALGELQYILAKSPNDAGEILTAAKLERPHVHTEEIQNASEATCQREGYTGDVYCKECGALVRKGSAISKKAHTSVTDAAVAATCTKAGKTQGSHCRVCGEVIKKQENIPALGHDWETEYTIDRPATAQEAGEKSIHCKRCEERTDIQPVPWEAPSHVHNIVNCPAVPATCTTPGKAAGKRCSECGEILEGLEEIPAKGHQIVEEKPVPATCTEAGKTAGKRCSECGEVMEESQIIPATGHDIEIDEAVPATCTEAGKTQGSHCRICEEIFQKPEIIPATGHDWEEEYTIDRPSTENEQGEKSIHCAKCEERKDIQTLPVKDPGHVHTVVSYPEKPASCVKAGQTSGSQCSECGETLEGMEEIPALGHDWEEDYATDVEPTKDTEGEESIHCTRCEERTDIRPIPKLESEQVDLKDCEIMVDDDEYVYDGKPKEPEVSIWDDEYELTPSVDYEVKYSDNVHAGEATVTIIGQGGYTGSVTENFYIEKAENQVFALSKYIKTTKTSAQSFKLNAWAFSGALRYQSLNKNIRVDKNGKVTIPKNFVGKAVVRVTAESQDYRKARKNITIIVNPARVSLTQVQNVSGRRMAVRWKKNAKVSGYQIQYSTNFLFSGARSKMVPGASKTAKTITGLKKGKNYYVRIRTYKTVSGVKYYSFWSGAKRVKIKK